MPTETITSIDFRPTFAPVGTYCDVCVKNQARDVTISTTSAGRTIEAILCGPCCERLAHTVRTDGTISAVVNGN